MARIDLHQLDEFNNQFVQAVQDGDVPAWDADTNNGEFVPRYLGQAQRFGENFQFQLNTTDIESSLTTFQDYIDWTTTSLPVGTYQLFVQVAWDTNNTNALLELQVLQDGVNIFPDNQVSASASTKPEVREYVLGIGQVQVTTEGPIRLQLQYKRSGSNGKLKIFNGYMQLYRIS